MKRNKNKTMVLSVAVLTLVLMMTACGGNNNANSAPSGSPSFEAGAEPTESANPSAPQQALSGSGEYVGLQDNHTLEITTEEGPVAYQISEEIMQKVESWENGTPVTYEYTEETLDTDDGKVTQLTITSIDKQ